MSCSRIRRWRCSRSPSSCATFEPLVKGESLAPAEIEQKLARRFRLLGTQGLVGIALAAIDMALWDALARSHRTSLARLLGGVEKPVPAYGAVGYDGERSSAQVAGGVGEARLHRRQGEDRLSDGATRTSTVIRAMRSAVGAGVAIMVDYNQCLTPAEAVQRMRVLDAEGLTWVEEPTLAHDYAGHAHVAREARNAHPVRRELVGHARLPARGRRARVGLRDARRDEDRRRHRLAPRGGHRAGARASACRTTCGPRSARSSCA